MVSILFHVNKRAVNKMVSSCTTRARKRKVNATAVKTEQSTTKKKRCSDKTMPKKTRAVLVKSVNSIEPSLLVDEVRHNIEEQFSDGKLNGFVETLLKGDEPMLEIAKHHRDSFVSLYDECNRFFRWNFSFHPFVVSRRVDNGP